MGISEHFKELRKYCGRAYDTINMQRGVLDITRVQEAELMMEALDDLENVCVTKLEDILENYEQRLTRLEEA